jgi:glycosyltransferase involved in cell wall biosynthesis
VYRSLDIVVHASTKPEPFGRTIAEAMACGRAVLLSRESGVAELVPASF